jgi:transcriptional regulator with XRE-family HTH domain
MKFGDKLRGQRKKNNIKPDDIAAAIGVTKWTLSNYERGVSHPKDRSIYFKLADFFKVDVNYFLTEDEEFLTEVAENYGKRGLAQAEALLEQAAAMFAGGELSEDDQMAFVTDMQLIFLDCKQKAQEKFTPNKYKIYKNPRAENK